MKLTHKGQTIEFDSSPEFSRNCMLVGYGEEEARLRQLFTPALLVFVGNLPPTDVLQIEGEGPTLNVYRSQRNLPAADVQAFLEKTSTIANVSEFLRAEGKRVAPDPLEVRRDSSSAAFTRFQATWRLALRN